MVLGPDGFLVGVDEVLDGTCSGHQCEDGRMSSRARRASPAGGSVMGRRTSQHINPDDLFLGPLWDMAWSSRIRTSQISHGQEKEGRPSSSRYGLTRNHPGKEPQDRIHLSKPHPVLEDDYGDLVERVELQAVGRTGEE